MEMKRDYYLMLANFIFLPLRLGWITRLLLFLGDITLKGLELSYDIVYRISLRLYYGEQGARLRLALASSSSYQEWLNYAKAIDELEGKDRWRKTAETIPNKYYCHYDQLEHATEAMNAAIKRNNPLVIASLIHRYLHRNYAGKDNLELYEHCTSGLTKDIILFYNKAILNSIHAIKDHALNGFDSISTEKLKDLQSILQDAKINYGNTGIFLSGGGTISWTQLHLMAALHEQNLIPKFLCGASGGSIVAGLVAVNPKTFTDIQAEPIDSDVIKFAKRLYEKGLALDEERVDAAMTTAFGDYTFEDVYQQNGITLCIAVSSSPVHEMPQTFNRVTTPNVFIRSASKASSAVPYVIHVPAILSRDPNDPTQITEHKLGDDYRPLWYDGSYIHQFPLATARSMFHVSQSIICNIEPFFWTMHTLSSLLRPIPLLHSKIIKLLIHEAQHRFRQGVIAYLTQDVSGDLIVYPYVSIRQIFGMFSDSPPSIVEMAQRNGRQAIYPCNF